MLSFVEAKELCRRVWKLLPSCISLMAPYMSVTASLAFTEEEMAERTDIIECPVLIRVRGRTTTCSDWLLDSPADDSELEVVVREAVERCAKGVLEGDAEAQYPEMTIADWNSREGWLKLKAAMEELIRA